MITTAAEGRVLMLGSYRKRRTTRKVKAIIDYRHLDESVGSDTRRRPTDENQPSRNCRRALSRPCDSAKAAEAWRVRIRDPHRSSARRDDVERDRAPVPRPD